MTFYTLKVIKGQEYVYMEERGRVDGKTVRTFQKYIGPRKRFPNLPIGKVEVSSSKDSLDLKVREFGLGASLWAIAQELDLPGIIDRHLGEQKAPHLSMGEYLTLAAINRVDDPGSKTALSSWFEKSWLSSQFDLNPDILNAQTYYNHFQRLTPELFTEIELELSQVIHTRFHLPLDRIFYDTTNFFTYAQVDDDEGLRRLGHSKQKQNGLPLVNYYLLCSKPYGIPLLHHTYAGNTPDEEKFKTVPEEILPFLHQVGIDLPSLTFFFDKGNLSPKLLRKFKRII